MVEQPPCKRQVKGSSPFLGLSLFVLFFMNSSLWLKASFWFDAQPSADFWFKKPSLYLALGVLVFSFVYLTLMSILFKNSKAQRILREEIFYFLFTVSFLFLLVWFFRSQSVAYLGCPFAFLLVGLIALVWIIYLIKVVVKVFLPLRKEEKEWERKKKYLPRAKTKN